MADRLNQYPMLPSNFTPAMLPQHHPQQAQQQAQGDSHTPLQGILNPEHNRMWQAMQQIQREQQYRSQNGGDIPGVQNSQQVADLLRSQSLARVQGQQQMGQQQQQQQFGLPSSQMNAPGQHSGYHDQHGSQQSNSQIPAGFGSNMGIPNATQLQANFNTRNAMLHAFNQPISRQLDMMGLQNQHQNAQGGSANFVARVAQQQQSGMNGQSQQGQPTIFSSPAMQTSDTNRASPPRPSSQTPGSMPNQQGGMQANGQGMPPGRRSMTFLELRERANQIQTYIAKQEAAAMTLNNNRASVEHGPFLAQMQALAADVRSKKELLAKLVQTMNHPSSNSSGNGPQGGNSRNMQPVSASPGPGPQQPGAPGQNQPGWIQQGSSPNQGISPMAHGGPPLPSRPAQSLQPSPQHHPPGQWQQNNLGPQRPGSTLHVAGQIPNQVSPSMSNQFPGNQLPTTQNGQNMPQIPLPPPLDKAKFEESYAAFRRSRPIKQDERLMRVDNRPIDLHMLHYNVLSEGGMKKVTAREMWPIIGARMGFVQFPGTDTEPAKAGPGVAQQLQHLYTECLAAFDNIYVASVFQKKGFFSSQAGASAVGGLQGNHPAANSPQINNPPSAQSNNGSPGNNIPGASQVSMMNAVMVYANVPAAELRARGVSEQVVHFVENHRAHLQRTIQQQQMFRGIIQKPNMSGQASEPGRNNQDAIGTFSGMLPLQQQGSMPPAGARQPPTGHSAGLSVNGTNNGQSQSPQKPPPTNGMATIPPSYPSRPTQEQSQEAILYIQRIKNDFVTHNLPNMKQYAVPENQKAEYIRTLEQAHRHAQELEPKLPMYFYVLKDPEMIRKLIAIIYTTREQRTLVADGAPKYILSLSTLSTLIQQIQQANAQFAAVANYLARPANDPTANGQQGSNGLGQRGIIPPEGPPQLSHQTPQQQPQPPQRIQTTPSLPPQTIPPAANRPVHLNPPPAPKKKAHQPALNAVASATASTPTPPASTPAASAATPATPAAASPKTPKSPKGKAASKPKATAKRKSRIPPTHEPVQPNAPSPSGSLKRQREEEEPMVSTPAVSNAPSPKKAKTEWEGEPSEALVKKEQEIENIKTEEDASAFLERMTELIRLAAVNDGQESLTSDISETLDMILKGCGQDTSDPGAMAPLGMNDVAGPPSSLLPAADEFQFKDFLDFTSCAADEDYSKPATPDLVASSSTNPSPESASDPADAAGQAATSHTADAIKLANFKIEDSYDSDLRLGVWKEIDGGESAYYQSDKWIWEGPMPALDQPWAFAPS